MTDKDLSSCPPPHRIWTAVFNGTGQAVCAFLALGMFTLCMPGCKPAQKQITPLETVRIGAFKGEFAAVVWLAESEGFFTKYGLNAQVTGFESGVAAVNSLMAGAQDVATAADYVFVHKSLANKSNLNILAEIARTDSFEIVARKDRGILSPADLKGKKIALTGQTPAVYFLDRYLVYQRIDPRTVTIVDLTPPKLIEAISLGSVDAAITWEPYVWEIQQKLAAQGLSWPAQSEQPFHFLLIGTTEFAEKRPATAKKIFQALVEAEDLIRKDPVRAQQALTRRLSLHEGYLAAVWSKHIIGLSLDQTLLVAMEDQARWAIAKGVVPADKSPNYLKSIFKEPLFSVRPTAVTLYQ